jgi:DNA-cytosine methyltransferase
MSELLTLLCDAVRTQGRDDAVALLLSGGIDSTSVGIALQKNGIRFQAYTYRLDGYPSKDLKKTIAIANHFGWPLTIVTVPIADAAHDFIRLAVEQRCRLKTDFENTFPMLYVLPRIAEAEVWTGYSADRHYGNSKNYVLHQRRMAREGASPAERKRAFDDYRRERFENGGRPDVYWCRLVVQHGKHLLDPYLDEAVREYFLQFDHEALSPPGKPVVRRALADELRDLPRGTLTVGIKLQTGGGVDALFETLLQDGTINRFETKYAKVAPLCQRWAKAVSERPEEFLAELEALPPPHSAMTMSSDAARYQPYTMADVGRASAARKFTVVSTFAGGGGSCIGFHLAGGHVALANEFVPEAARTYRTNFPNTMVDTRDIREVTADVDAFLAQAGLIAGVFDILNGSPPCCEFSTAGRGLSDPNELRPYSDTRQRDMATLILDFFKLARQARPKVVIGENVPNLAGTRHGAFFQGALDTLRFGDPSHTRRLYYVNWRVLSASGFGVPQKRDRLFFIGVRKDVAGAVGIASDDDVLTLFPEPNPFSVSVRSALQDLRQCRDEIEPWLRAATTSSVGRWIDLLPRNPTKRTFLRDVGVDASFRFSLSRCAWDLPAPTLAVMGQGPDALSGLIHPEANRKFTIPELKRLTALPEDFRLTGTLKQGAERICRMVPPRVMQAIAERVHAKVLQPHAEGLS